MGAALGAILTLIVSTACGKKAPPRPGAHETSSAASEVPDWRQQEDQLEPPGAIWATVDELRADLQSPRSEADGGGSAELVESSSDWPARLQSPGRWTIEYTAGPRGIAEGGALYFYPNPFWGWSPPQTERPDAPGFVTVRCDVPEIELLPRTLPGMVLFEIRARELREGESVQIVYGDGSAGAMADRYAEGRARLWIAVDGDGDGVRKPLEDSPAVRVLPGPPSRLLLTLTSRAAPGDPVRLNVCVLDAWANTNVEFSGRITLTGAPDSWSLPGSIEVEADKGSRAILEFVAQEEGLLRIRGQCELEGEQVEATSNPLWVEKGAAPLFWGDLHGHSDLSDGTGTPEDYFTYARDVAALDVVSLTDHDHHGVVALDQSPKMWSDMKALVAMRNEPGRFLTLLGYEWTSWIHGHRHVLYFEDDGEVHSSIQAASETPRQLWDLLRGQAAMTFAHHSAGSPIRTNWSFAPDPVLEPLTEISSVHGSSEAMDSPARIAGAVPGNFVRDVLDHGYRLGFVGSGDSHDGHPGLPHLSPGYRWMRRPDGSEWMGTGGVAAIAARELTREAVLEALRARAVWATSGPRILLDVELEGHSMGSAVSANDLPPTSLLSLRVIGTAELERIDLIRSGSVHASVPVEAGRWETAGGLEIEGLEAGEYLYLRAVQRDKGLAWSSPIFLE